MDNQVNVYAIDNAYALHTTISPSIVKSWKVDFDPSGKYVLCGTTSLALVNVDDGKKVEEFATNSRFINCLRYSPSGKLIACGNVDGGVMFYETQKFTRVCKLEDHGLPVRDLAFAPDESFMLTVADDMLINATNM